jgi:two-component system sensor kinase FixL
MVQDLAMARRDGRWEGEGWRIRRDGSAFYAGISVAAVEAGGYVVVLQDVTGPHRARLELEASEAQLRSILATVPDAMIIIDEAGLIEAFSATAERLFGWSAEEAIGRNVDFLMPAPHRDLHDGYLRRYQATGRTTVIGKGRVVLAHRRDGSTFPIELCVGEVPPSGGRGRLFTGIIRDLTEHHRSEARLQALERELAQLSRLGTVGTLASALAHELNQPLTAAANSAHAAAILLEAEAPDAATLASAREAAEAAAAQAVRAGQIVCRLREYVRRGDVEKRPEKPAALVEEAAALTLASARERGLRVQLDLEPDLPEVLVARLPLQQVLVNLMRNALEAMAGMARRELAIRAATVDGGRAVEFTIADTGPGVEPEVAARLFEPHASSKPDGMGVGLAICRAIVEEHGGRLRLEPRNGDWATVFRFDVPVFRPVAQPDHAIHEQR